MTEHLRVGDRVNVDTCEGFGGPGVIVAERPVPGCRFKVRLEDGRGGQDFWAHDFEVSCMTETTKAGYDSRPETVKHIRQVQQLLYRVIADLERRANEHDASKLVSPEVEAFDEFTPKLAASTYGSEEYERMREAIKPALEHHYQSNSHHPEHYAIKADGSVDAGALKSGEAVSRMSLLDVIEMACADWPAAVMRHGNGDLRKSLEINRGRFGLCDQLVRIIRNTHREMGLPAVADDAGAQAQE